MKEMKKDKEYIDKLYADILERFSHITIDRDRALELLLDYIQSQDRAEGRSRVANNQDGKYYDVQ